MKKEYYKLKIVKCKNDPVWFVYPMGMPDISVRVEKESDAPKELAKLFKELMEHNLTSGNFERKILE